MPTVVERPALSEVTREILEGIAADWRRDGLWPRRKSVGLRCRRLGLVLDEVVRSASVFLQIDNREQDERVRLTLIGLEMCSGGEAEVQPFLSLLQRGIIRFIANPGDDIGLRRIDLQEILGPERVAEEARLTDLYHEEWRGSRGRRPDGDWYLGIRLEHVRLEGAPSAWECYAREHTWPRTLGSLEPVHIALLSRIHAWWQETLRWPSVLRTVVELRRFGDVLTMLREVPDSLLEKSRWASPEDEYRLTPAGVAHLGVRTEPHLLVRALALLQNHYDTTDGEGSLTAAELAKRLEVPIESVARLRWWFDEIPGVRVRDCEDTWVVEPGEPLLDLGPLASYEDFAKVMAARSVPIALTTDDQPADVAGAYDAALSNPQRVLEEQDFLTHARRTLLPTEGLDPFLIHKAHPLFLRGDYDTAIFQAFKEVEIRVRKKGQFGNGIIGVDLMRKAFAPDIGPLTNLTLERGEQTATMDLFAGAVGKFKNPSSHRDVEYSDAQEVADLLRMANHLLRIIDRAESRP